MATANARPTWWSRWWKWLTGAAIFVTSSLTIVTKLPSAQAVIAPWVGPKWTALGLWLTTPRFLPTWGWVLLAVFVGLPAAVIYVWLVDGLLGRDSSEPESHAYTTDEFFGASVSWTWQFGGPHLSPPLCPHCQHELRLSGDYVWYFRCENCDWRSEEIPADWESETKRHIRRKVRTGEWKEMVVDDDSDAGQE